MTAAKELRKTSSRYPFGLLVHGRRKGGKTLAFLLARQRATRAVLGMVVPRSSSGENGYVEGCWHGCVRSHRGLGEVGQ